MTERSGKINESTQSQIDRIAETCARIKPLVAIRCITYNHEPYLRDALEGFVMQKTDFPFVAVVHDDASTDGTAAIIHEYAERYPDIILPIYETENQYSKRDGSLDRIMLSAFESTNAKYYAWCEGDDYWIDPLKLQKQITFMEENLGCSMCFTNCIAIDGRSGKESFRFNNYEQDQDAPIDDLILKGGAFCATATFVVRTTMYDKMPKILKQQYVGDYVVQMYMGYIGTVHYLKDITSIYRSAVEGSWTARVLNISFDKRVSEVWPKNEKLFKTMDEATNYNYSTLLNGAMYDLMFWDCRRYGKYVIAIKMFPKLYRPFERYGYSILFELFGLGYIKRQVKKIIGRKIIE